MVKEKKRAIISIIILAGGKSSRIGLDKDKGHMPLSG
jgi:molybdopterin-guanine dinucleotide biosynthesis protein A